MASQKYHEHIPKEGPPVPQPTQLELEGSEAIQVLKTVKNLIVELHSFKTKNEKLKRAQEKQQDISGLLFQSLQERNNGEKQLVESRRDPKVGDNIDRKDSSSQETQRYGNQEQTMDKRNVDHQEGEFKKIKPTNFDGESRTGE